MPIVILKFYRFIKYYFVVKIHISIVNVQFQYVAANVRAWRCGDIPCYVSRDMLSIKDMKIKIYSKAGIYSSVGYVAE